MSEYPAIQFAIEDTLRFLEASPDFGKEHGESSRHKWEGVWWHLATLYEMGEVNRIPGKVVADAKRWLETKVWQAFVITTADLPSTMEDKMKLDCCHCELAVYYMILKAYGCDLDNELPWIRKWLLKHQLPDGGLNCEPEAYLDSKKSSMISTLPPLEAILWYTDREFTKQESKFLDEGARYIMEHHLVCSKQDGTIIDENWLKPCFPRFFEYDILRGMSFLAEWSRRRNQDLPADLLREGIERLKPYRGSEGLRIGRQVFDPQGPWGGNTFPLLEAVSSVGDVSPYLTRHLNEVIAYLK